jgi:hypothetical protein
LAHEPLRPSREAHPFNPPRLLLNHAWTLAQIGASPFVTFIPSQEPNLIDLELISPF